MRADPTVSFGGWTLNRASGELARDGRVSRLSQQPLCVLLELIDSPGKVVSRERLVHALWPKGIVDFDNNLNGIVRKLRIALEDDSETPRYVETLPRIGYRFIGKIDAPVSEVSTPQVARLARPRPWKLVAVLGTVLCVASVWWITRPPPLATQAGAVNVSLVPRRTTSQRAYQYYLDGIYQRSRRDADATARAIAALEAALREDPDYAEAWAALAGTLLGAAVTQDDPVLPLLERARDAARRAVVLDEALPDAHVALAQVYTHFERDYAAAEREFAIALAANDRHAGAWAGVAVLRAFQARIDEALAAMRRARELEPMRPHFNSQYGVLLYHARRFDEAVAHVTPLLAAQPQFDQARSVLIRALVAQGHYEKARAQARLRIGDLANMSDLGLILAKTGQRTEALAEAARIEARSRAGFGVSYEAAVIYAALGELERACAALVQSLAERSVFAGWARLDPRFDALRGTACFAVVERQLDGSRTATRPHGPIAIGHPPVRQ
jgi:DNA-binding winged helix-turn-helix (wHTH) protein/tetratricopeptide (TPR) repeat protein